MVAGAAFIRNWLAHEKLIFDIYISIMREYADFNY